jgi:putative lipoic acid-binding regulatory protein
MDTNINNESLIKYPCIFPIKVMGKNHPDFKSAVAMVCREFDPQFKLSEVEERNSKANNYLGLTVNINATSREQLDEIYRTLSTHPLVSVVL